MFGSNSNDPNASSTSSDSAATSTSPPSTSPTSPSAAEKKSRRISSSAKVSNFVASAKQSFGGNSDKKAAAIVGAASPGGDLSTNNAAGDSKPTATSTFRVGVTEDKNKKCRRTMEDTHAFIYNFLPSEAPTSSDGMLHSTLEENHKGESDNGYFAIFDGHAGTYAADWCGKKVHHLLEDNIRKNPDKPVPEVMDLTFTNADKELKDLPVRNSGCTAVCALLRWEQRKGEESGEIERTRVLYTANVGDARIVLCRAGKALRLSYDHKGSDENEGKRVTSAGGLILNNRVNGVLAVTRALGDAYIKQLVTGHPYTTETVIQPDVDEFIILACDGLWDVCSDQEAVDLVRTVQDPQDASKMLVDHALARFSTDNLSCMIVRLEKQKEHNTALGVGLGLVDPKGRSADSVAVVDEDTVMSDADAKKKPSEHS